MDQIYMTEQEARELEGAKERAIELLKKSNKFVLYVFYNDEQGVKIENQRFSNLFDESYIAMQMIQTTIEKMKFPIKQGV